MDDQRGFRSVQWGAGLALTVTLASVQAAEAPGSLGDLFGLPPGPAGAVAGDRGPEAPKAGGEGTAPSVPRSAETSAVPASRADLFGLPAAPPEPAATTPAATPPPAPATPASREELFALPAPPAAEPAVPSEVPVTGLAATGTGGVAVDGFLSSTVAYTYADPEHWSLFQNMLQVSASGRLGDGVKWKAGVRGFVDPVYAGSDFYPDDVRDDQKADGLIWETYLDFATGPVEWRVGRQHIVWGEVIAFFFADVVSAFDQRQFLLPDFEYTRLPQWAARAEYFEGDFHAEAVWVPVMTYDEIGKPGADFYPFRVGPDAVILNEDKPDNDLGHSGYGLRASYLKNGWDGSLFAWSAMDHYPVFERSLSLGPSPVVAYRPIHERIHQYGGTLAKDLGPAVVKAEAVYTHGQLYETTALDEMDGLVRGDELAWIASAEFVFQDETRLNFQFVHNRYFDHERGFFVDDVEDGVSVYLSTRAFHPKVEPELLYITSLNRTDWNLQARVTWEFRPNWRVAGGVDVFNGSAEGFMGRFDAQDRVYGELRYDF
jgi:hypothetical protein